MIGDTAVDVICQHSKDGRIMPIKVRVKDEDGEYQIYSIKNFREVPKQGAYTTIDGKYISNSVTVFECQIVSFGRKRQIRLYYSDNDGKFSMCS